MIVDVRNTRITLLRSPFRISSDFQCLMDYRFCFLSLVWDLQEEGKNPYRTSIGSWCRDPTSYGYNRDGFGLFVLQIVSLFYRTSEGLLKQFLVV